MKCEICGKEVKSLGHHVQQSHKVIAKDYYDKYLKEKDDGICKVCRNPTSFNNLIYGYRPCCSPKCAQKFSEEKCKQTCLERFGVPYASQSTQARKKQKQRWKNYTDEERLKIIKNREDTCIKKYGVSNQFKCKDIIEKSKKTKLEKYGHEYYSNWEKSKETLKNKTEEEKKEISERRRKTMLDKYGYGTNMENPETMKKLIENSHTKEALEKQRKTNLEKYGVENQFQRKEIQEKSHSKEVIQKGIKTKIKNGNFNTSKPEEDFYNRLLEKFSKEDIFRNYNKDSRYPYHVDFYIKSLDMFIELNLFWTHGGHIFNKNSKDDIKALSELKKKSKNSDWYKQAIYVWTILDIEKIETAQKNNLNYYTLYNNIEINNFLKEVLHYDTH